VLGTHKAPGAQADTVQVPPWQTIASCAVRQWGSEAAAAHDSPGSGIPVSQVSAEPAPLQCAGPLQLCSCRHRPPAQVMALRPSGVHATESLPGVHELSATGVPGATDAAGGAEAASGAGGM
jgi:hypothetical protein